MSISPILMAVVNPSATQADMPAVKAGFDCAMGTVRSGAPPGPEPPPGISVLTLPEEAGKTEPNAPFQELDLLAAMKNLTEGFFDGVTVDAPMPAQNPGETSEGDTKSPELQSQSVQAFLSAGAMVMSMMPDQAIYVPAVEPMNQEVPTVGAVDAKPVETKAQPTTDVELPVVFDATLNEAAAKAATDEAIAISDADLSKSAKLDEKSGASRAEATRSAQTPAVEPNPIEKRDMESRSEMLSETIPYPAEQLPTEGKEPVSRSDYFGSNSKVDNKDELIEPTPKPAEEVPEIKGDAFKPMPKPAEPVPASKADTSRAATFGDSIKAVHHASGEDSKAQNAPKSVEGESKAEKLGDSKSEAFIASKSDAQAQSDGQSKSDLQNKSQDNPNASYKPNDPNAPAKPGQPNSEYKGAVEAEPTDSKNEVSRSAIFNKIEDAVQPASRAEAQPVYTTNTVNAPAQNAATVDAKAEVQPLDRATASHVLRQVADRLESLAAARPRNGVTIHLEPFDLGKVTMTIKSSGNEVEAHIAASHEAVRQALEQSRPLLQQALDQRGISLVNVDVSSQTLTQDAPNRQQQSRNMQPQTQTGNSWSQGDRGGAMSVAETRSYVAKAAGGVNLWI